MTDRTAAEAQAVAGAINRLHFMRRIEVNGSAVELVLLVHPDGWRPLLADWWTGKQASIIGADASGNFVLRLSDGSVGLWNHNEGKASPVARSVRTFVSSIH